MAEALIYDAVRTPRGRGKDSGSLYTVHPVKLLAQTLNQLSERTSLDTTQVDDVVVGCVAQVNEQGACVARTAVLMSDYDIDVAAVTVNRFCGSGLQAINQAACMVASGFHGMVVAGGVESMSRVPMGADGGAMFDPFMQWKHGGVPQGISADLMATLNGFSRQDVDAFAVRSQDNAGVAIEKGHFNKSLFAVVDENGLTLLDRDEHPRPGTTLEGLGKLKPSFAMMGEQFGLDAITRKRYPQVERIHHVHHAGNSSGIVDGAAALLLGTREKGAAMGLTPRAKIVSMSLSGSDPLLMLDGPISATEKALAKAGMEIGDIDLFEVNEAFAAVPLLFMKHFGVSRDVLNVDGGAIALGHPLGATGAMLLNTALDALEREDKNTALVTLCIGGGMGIATIIERV
jgi:acetyl-CoA C-acetyltransferase